MPPVQHYGQICALGFGLSCSNHPHFRPQNEIFARRKLQSMLTCKAGKMDVEMMPNGYEVE